MRGGVWESLNGTDYKICLESAFYTDPITGTHLFKKNTILKEMYYTK